MGGSESSRGIYVGMMVRLEKIGDGLEGGVIIVFLAGMGSSVGLDTHMKRLFSRVSVCSGD